MKPSRWYGKQVTIVLRERDGACLCHSNPEGVLLWLSKTNRKDIVVAYGDDCCLWQKKS